MSGESEVADFDNSFVCQKNIFRFDIAMKTTLIWQFQHGSVSKS